MFKFSHNFNNFLEKNVKHKPETNVMTPHLGIYVKGF